ncbi:copper resistance protein CopC [Glycocaulis profundi]|jgi:copper resistance protein C|nr:copper resistance protein CopC [Glycocaulis profundi]
MSMSRLFVACAASAMLTAAAYAHTVISHSNIGDGAVLASAPADFDFGFADPVSLVGLELLDETGGAVDIGFRRVSGMQKDFSVPLPDLEEGGYSLNWRAVAQDGHVMSGAISFRLDSEAAEGSSGGASTSDRDSHGGHHGPHSHEPAHGQDHSGHEDMAGLVSSFPADGDTLESGTDRIELRFDHPMAVRSIQLSTLAMERIAVEFEAGDGPVSEISARTEPLDPGDYELVWRADGGDHEMSGTIRFRVE